MYWKNQKGEMDRISDVSVGPLRDSKYIQCYQVSYKQNGKQRYWDCLRQHDSVGVLIYNVTRQALVVVTQFRPAVYMSSNRPVWENSEIFTSGSLNMKANKVSKSQVDAEGDVTPPKYGPSSEGMTYELCAGIVDKDIPLAEIAREEVQEETGYQVKTENLQYITSFWSNIGTAGSKQSLFYCEVTDEMIVGSGGGNLHEGEMIDVLDIPIGTIDEFIFDESKKKSMGLCFGFSWFAKNILPKQKNGQ